MDRQVHRASLATVIGAVLVLMAGCAPSPATAPSETAAGPSDSIKIAALTSLSGPFTPWGVKVRDGMKYAAEELNQAGGVLGRQINIIERDDKNNPDEAVTALRGLIEREGVVAAGGVISSDVGLATSRVAEEAQVPLFLTMSGSDAILKQSSRYTFRTCLLSAPMNMSPVAALIKERGYQRVGAIIADYAWGHAIGEAIKQQIQPLPGVTVQIETAPVSEQDFTPYLRRLQSLNPEVLILMGHPPGNFPGAKQAIDLGVGQLIVGSWSPPETWMQRVGPPIFGRVLEGSCTDWADPAYQQLAEQFRASTGSYFDFNASSGYALVKMVADAIKKTGSTDPKAIADTIRGGSFRQPGYAYPLSYSEWGELREATPVMYTFEAGDPPGGINPGAGWHPQVLFRSPRVEPVVPKE